MKIHAKPQRSAEHDALRLADREYMSRNANLNQRVDPLDVEAVALEGPWRGRVLAVLPEVDDINGQRLTFTQIGGDGRNRVSQLFERIGFGGVNFGVISGPRSFDVVAELVPLTREHLDRITPETVVNVSNFRGAVAKTISQLRSDPQDRWRYIRHRDQILAAIDGQPEDPNKDRQPWYAHLPLDVPPIPVRSKEHYQAWLGDTGFLYNNEDLDEPFVPLQVEGHRLDGPWRHHNVTAIVPDMFFPRAQVLSIDYLKETDIHALLERIAYTGSSFPVEGDRGTEQHLGLLSRLAESDLKLILRDSVIEAAAFQADVAGAAELARSKELANLFLRSRNRIHAMFKVAKTTPSEV